MKNKKIEEVEWPTDHMGYFVHHVITNCKPDLQLEISGKIPSKKNLYSPMANGKGFFKGSKLLNAEKVFSLQIPGEYRDLKLENPHIVIQLKLPKKSWRSDRDNAVTTILDYLVKFGVLKDDSINHLNGALFMAPVIESSEYKCLISIWRNE